MHADEPFWDIFVHFGNTGSFDLAAAFNTIYLLYVCDFALAASCACELQFAKHFKDIQVCILCVYDVLPSAFPNEVIMFHFARLLQSTTYCKCHR